MNKRQALAERIIADAEPLVTGSTDKWGEAQKAKARAEWIERVRQSQLSDLERIRAKQLQRQGSREGAKQIVKQAETERRQAAYDSRYAVLPPLYEPPGKEGAGVGVPWSKRLIARLAEQAPKEVRRLFKIYSEQQITDAINRGAAR